MNLDENQKKQLTQWVEEGLKLSEIQNRLASELGIKLTYMEVRLLVDDLKLTLKEPERLQTPELPTAPKEQDTNVSLASEAKAPGHEPVRSGVSVTVDTLTKPGALVSGKATFSDGNTAEWYLDQMGRLGLVPQKEGYRPSAADLKEFQVALEREITRAGY